MKKSREFGEGPIFTITNYIMWLFAGNFYFAICNIPLIFMLVIFLQSADKITSDMLPSFLLIFAICLIPVAPAITALLSVMGKLIREKDISITKDYFKAYKSNFKQSIILGIIEIAVICILMVDFYFFSRQSYGVYIKFVFLLLIFLVLIISLYVFPIVSRFYMKNTSIIKLSYYYSIAKFNVTILNICCIVFCFFILKYFSFLILFFISGACYLVMLNENKILKEIEEKMITSQPQEKVAIDDEETDGEDSEGQLSELNNFDRGTEKEESNEINSQDDEK